MINLFITSNKVIKPVKVKNPEKIQLIYIDLFCGAGGTTTGILQTKIGSDPCAIVAACVNHDPKAIKSHWMNHPEVVHFEEDIRTLELSPLIDLTNTYRELYPNAKIVLWASLECTNFSNAKGGQPRDADSRTLAEHLDRYVEALNPDYIQIENVVEFRSWGPLCKNGKPVNTRKGEDWMRWRERMKAYGYRDEWKEMNSANYGAYTSRNRLFGCFAKHELPIVWPEPTHAKKPETGNCTKIQLKKWKPVKEVLDFKDEGQSIFTRKKPLVENTLKRIYAGLIKEVAGGKDAFLTQYNSGSERNRVISIDSPCNTIPTNNRFSIITTSFLTKYYGNGENISSINEPAGTITTKDRFSKIQINWLDKQYSGPHNHQSINVPAGTIMTSDKHALMTAKGFIYNPSHGGHTMSINVPCPVIIARQDKAPLYLIQYQIDKNVQIPVYPSDCETMILIKEFMALFSLSDIKMRMLKILELLPIQGFSKDYKLIGNQSDQKKFIGNSVVPEVVRAWIQTMALKLNTILNPENHEKTTSNYL